MSHGREGGVSWEIEDVKADMLRVSEATQEGGCRGPAHPERHECFIAVPASIMRGRGRQKCPERTNATRK